MASSVLALTAATETLLRVARQQVVQFGVPHGKMCWRTRDWGREVILKGVNIGRISQAQVARGRDLLEVGQIDAGLLLTHTGLLRRCEQGPPPHCSGVATPCE